MQRFEDVFSKYIEKRVTHPALLAGEVTGIQIATEENAVQISMAAGALIPYAAVAEAQRTLAMGLAARSVTILVHYPQQLLGEDAFRLILDYLKAENVPVNGFFQQAGISYEPQRFAVRLAEQTAAFLEPFMLPGKIAAKAEALFGLRPQVSFIPVPEYEWNPPVPSDAREDFCAEAAPPDLPPWG